MISLDEAIKHCLEVAKKNEEECKNLAYGASQINDDESRKKQYLKHAEMCKECAKEHRQLAEWLRELKAYREAKERIRRGLQSCFNMVHCESNHDILEGQERAFKYCIEQLEVNADELI